MSIQWYPGHMAKTWRAIEADLKLVDVVAAVLDARIPHASFHPAWHEMRKRKPMLLILNRTDLADPAKTKEWKTYFQTRGMFVLLTDCKTGSGVNGFASVMRALLAEKLQKRSEKGQAGRGLRAMVVGIPNVGKSSFINRVSRRKTTKTEDRPGVTRGRQWIAAGGAELLDTPGVLWPRFEDERTGLHLAYTGAIRDAVLDEEDIAARLIQYLAREYAPALCARLKWDEVPSGEGFLLLEKAALSRGFLLPGGKADTLRCAQCLLDEFRGGKLGRVTLEAPSDDGFMEL